MKRCGYLISLMGMLLVGPLYAEQHAPQTLRVIPKTYISPGASGSVGSSQQVDNHNLYGGQRLPSGLQQHQQRYDSRAVEHRGALKQSIEYPNGYRVQQFPGQGSAYHERRR
jgi:hypothetical protein